MYKIAVKTSTSRSELAMILREDAGGSSFLSIQQLVDCLKKDRDTVNCLVNGLDAYMIGKRKHYLVDDVARKMYIEKIPGTWTG